MWSVPADAQHLDEEELLAALGTSTVGLTAESAAQRLAQHPNTELGSAHPHSALRLLVRQYASPLTLVLVAATMVSMAVGEVRDGLIILAIIVPTGLLGFWQEHAASRLMAALTQRLQPTAVVRRDGVATVVAARDVVPGDVLELSVGAVIAADARVLESAGLEVDESTLSGESLAVAKSAGTDRVCMGTHVTAGTGAAVVYATGRDTEYGAIASDVEAPAHATSFERGSTKFGMLVVRYIALLLTGVFAVNVILHRPFVDSLLFSLSLAVGLTPQLLPVIVTVTLSAGARHLAAADVLVKRLDAIEDFGSMTILCSDKPGTLTAGVVSLDRAVEVSG
jgi:Mg2+-importing ATPase